MVVRSLEPLATAIGRLGQCRPLPFAAFTAGCSGGAACSVEPMTLVSRQLDPTSPALPGSARTYNASVQPSLAHARIGVEVATARIGLEPPPRPLRGRWWMAERGQGEKGGAPAGSLRALAHFYGHAQGVDHDLA